MDLMWQVEKQLLLGELNDLINQASKTANLADTVQLDQIATLQAFKTSVLRANDDKTFHELAEQWQQTNDETVTVREVKIL